jgi:hypothetical protein
MSRVPRELLSCPGASTAVKILPLPTTGLLSSHFRTEVTVVTHLVPDPSPTAPTPCPAVTVYHRVNAITGLARRSPHHPSSTFDYRRRRRSRWQLAIITRIDVYAPSIDSPACLISYFISHQVLLYDLLFPRYICLYLKWIRFNRRI